MKELIPVVFGLVLAGGVLAFRVPRVRAIGTGALVLGPVATFLTGEASESPLFFLIDFGIVFAAAWAVVTVVERGRRRRAPDRARAV